MTIFCCHQQLCLPGIFRRISLKKQAFSKEYESSQKIPWPKIERSREHSYKDNEYHTENNNKIKFTDLGGNASVIDNNEPFFKHN